MSGSDEARVGYLGLGSNQGDPGVNLDRAIAALEAAGVGVEAESDRYLTGPVGEILDQPDFLNSALRIRTGLAPEDLLDVCKRIELDLGRDPGAPRHSPRPVDIDMLLLGDLEFESERLRLPHREVANRRFVIVPLLDLDPELTLPDGTRLADRLVGLADDGQRVVPA